MAFGSAGRTVHGGVGLSFQFLSLLPKDVLDFFSGFCFARYLSSLQHTVYTSVFVTAGYIRVIKTPPPPIPWQVATQFFFLFKRIVYLVGGP